MAHVTLVYTALARNRSPADLEAALAAIALDTDTTTLLGLSLSSDTPAASGNVVTRTIVYQTGTPPQIIPDSHIGETLVKMYEVTFTKALATPVLASPPVVT